MIICCLLIYESISTINYDIAFFIVKHVSYFIKPEAEKLLDRLVEKERDGKLSDAKNQAKEFLIKHLDAEKKLMRVENREMV